MPGCLDCYTGSRCNKCEAGTFLTYLEDGCQTGIDHCNQPDDNLSTDGHQYVCGDCERGYYTEGNKCLKCQIPGCDDCVSLTQCRSCIKPQRFNPAGDLCVNPIPDCLSDPMDYVEDADDSSVWSCPHCKDGTLWSSAS